MKKAFAAILAALFIVSPVFAAENIVYIYEEDGKIYYSGSQFDDRFMIHENMVPGGETYTDELKIENGTSKAYDIYFKITAENNSAKARNLIEHIDMELSIDGVKFYDGKARGLDYRGEGVDLTDAVKIGYFEPGRSVTMTSKTFLDASYEDINNPDTSRTHWHFYIVDEEKVDPDNPVKPEEVVPNPKTEDDFTPWFFVLLGISIALFIFITVRERHEHSKHSRD